jgi:hypothetical protein
MKFEYSVYKNNGDHMGIMPKVEALKFFTEPRHHHFVNGVDKGRSDYHAYPVIGDGESRRFELQFAEDFETLDRYFNSKSGECLRIGVGEGGRMKLLEAEKI